MNRIDQYLLKLKDINFESFYFKLRYVTCRLLFSCMNLFIVWTRLLSISTPSKEKKGDQDL